jgi:hypothetical protein
MLLKQYNKTQKLLAVQGACADVRHCCSLPHLGLST